MKAFLVFVIIAVVGLMLIGCASSKTTSVPIGEGAPDGLSMQYMAADFTNPLGQDIKMADRFLVEKKGGVLVDYKRYEPATTAGPGFVKATTSGTANAILFGIGAEAIHEPDNISANSTGATATGGNSSSRSNSNSNSSSTATSD